jgi:hypothetical protein
VLRRLIMGLIVAVAIGGIVWVFSGPTPSDDRDLPAAVEAVSPQGGDLDLRQATISVDLAIGVRGVLMIDGVEVPEDDLQRVEALNTITLRPGPDSDYRELRPGPHCATVVYWPLGQTRDDSSAFRWCFSLH